MKRFLKIFTAGIATFSDAPVAARIGMLLFFAAATADGILMPFFALWAHDVAGIPIVFIGLLLGCYAGGELLATPFVGGIADRIGRRPVLLVSTSGVGLGFLGLFFIHGAIAAAVALIAIGMFESVLHPTAATVIADVVPEERRRACFALRRVMSNAGGMVGPALGALLALHSLRLVFLGAAVTLLTSTVIVATLLKETRPQSASGEDADDDESLMVLTAAFHDRRLASLLLPAAAMEIALSWIYAVTPLYANAAGTLSASGVGLLFTYAGALGVLLQFPVTQGSSRLSGFAIVSLSGVMQVIAFACLFASPALVSLIVAVTLLALSQMLYGPLVQTVITELAPKTAQATYQAAFSVASDLRDAAGPAIGTWLLALAPGLPWMSGIIIAAAAAFGLATAARRHEQSR
ncbi:MAG: MFS transporter [Xanthobacteraceae bacterium]